MENFSYNSYPESGDSSPRSREIDFENPPPWDDGQQLQTNYKVKFMCSYGGKIHPRQHDNQLSYVAGETKILAVERNIKFASMLTKLSTLCDSPVTFKYQLPGEDLDALITVTNDDDLEHLMHEYDRLYRASNKPARMRLFLFPVNPNPDFGSDGDRSDRERFVDALNSAPAHVVEPAKPPMGNNVDFLFGLDKGAAPAVAPAAAMAAKMNDQMPEPVAPPPDFANRPGAGDRIAPPDPIMNPAEIQRQLQRLHISEQEQGIYRRKSEDNLVGGYGGDYYVQKVLEKTTPATLPMTAQLNTTAPSGFWPDKQVSSGGFPGMVTATPGASDHPVYMIPAPGTVYHQAPPPLVRPVTGPASQGYYTMQRVSSDVYRDQPVYNVVPTPQQPFSAPSPPTLQQQPPKVGAYTEGMGVGRQSGGTGGVPLTMDTSTYAHVAYDSATGRQVYYTAVGGAGVAQPPQYQGIPPPVSSDMRQGGGAVGQDGKFVTKVSQGPV